MQHFNESLPGMFDYANWYSDLIKYFPGGNLVEVGVFGGRSIAYLAVEAINSGKPFKIAGIDQWPANEEFPVTFKSVLASLEPVSSIVELIRGDSADSASLFADASIESVFIDADHQYESVKRDILAWLPKVKPGGIISGHDYSWAHPGVIKAIDELFPKIERACASVWLVNV